MSLDGPLEHGGYYMTDDDSRGVFGPMTQDREGLFWSRGVWFRSDGTGASPSLTRRVHVSEVFQIPDLKAKAREVVAELRRLSNSEHEKAKAMEPGNSDYHAGIGYGLQDAADLVAAKLGVTDPPKPPESA